MKSAEDTLDSYEYIEHDGETVSIHEGLIHEAMNEYRVAAFIELFDRIQGGDRNSISTGELNKFIKQLKQER
jgi:hypothetical protein